MKNSTEEVMVRNKRMDTFSQVKDAFYSGEHAFTGDRQIVRDIAFLVDENYLTLRVCPIGTMNEYREILHTLEHQEGSYEAAGGGNTHTTLKLLSGAYLRNRFGQGIKYEHPFCGHYPDVMTDDGRIVVECGHTNNPEKMLTYFRQGNIEECLLVPYPDPELDIVPGYSFAALDELKKFLDFWESEKHLELKKKLNK